MKTNYSIDVLEQTILHFLQEHSDKSYRIRDILSALGLEKDRSSAVKRALRHLVSQNEAQKLISQRQIRFRRKGKYFAVAQRSHTRTGTFEPGRFGAAYVRTKNGDLFIPAGYTYTALPGDLVKVVPLSGMARYIGPTPEAEVIDVLKRSKTVFAGVFTKDAGGGFVLPDSEFLKRQIFVPERKTRKAQHGQQVAVKVVAWDNEFTNPYGEIIEIIGYPGERGVDALSMAHVAGIPIRFPERALKEAKSLMLLNGQSLEDSRKDFRNEEVFTIDPEDAKDFDDAVSLNRLPDGNYLLGVYIADVTAYVLEGSAIDKEAAKRGTSVYLIDKVIPMLPERLSEDLCSLRPHEDRPVFCIRMTCTPGGEVIAYEITEGIIRSRHRFSYEEAQAVIDCKKRGPFRDTLREMNRFAKILRKKRFKSGGLDFFVPEVGFKLDKNGMPVSIFVKPLLETHSLIEEFMLLANRVAAEHKVKLERQYRMSLPYLYRVHEEPDEESTREFGQFARSLGCTVNKGAPGSSQWFQNILRYFDDKPEKILIEEIAIHSMMKAMYKPRNIGHFGLGFKEYTHFTSPIRRYPDMIVHRLLKKYSSGVNSGEITSLHRKMGHIGKHSTETEIRAMKTERDVIKLKQLEYMTNKIGEIYRGVISGVRSFGIFVELEDILVAGLVHISDLDDDFYIYEGNSYRLVGERNGRVFKLGDRITVQVINVSVERGHLDLIPV